MKRKSIRNVRKDQRIFSRTAKSAKKINLAPKIMRGGIRL